MTVGVALFISYAARTIVLTVLLWIMVKLQKLDYFLLGLLGSAALASALDMLPYFGHYLAVPVLYLCIWKVTRASLMPDAVFTVAVAYALMFAVRVFLLAELLPVPHPLDPATNPFVPQPAREIAVPQIVVTAPQKPPPTAPKKTADDWLKEVTFKGVTDNGDKSVLLLRAGTNLYNLEMNDPIDVSTAGGTCRMRLLRVSANWATVEVNGEAAYLQMQ
jgi:hypothetical protein